MKGLLSTRPKGLLASTYKISEAKWK